MILEMGCKLRILSLKCQLKLHNLRSWSVRRPILPPFQMSQISDFPGEGPVDGQTMRQGQTINLDLRKHKNPNILICSTKPDTLPTTQSIKVGHSILCFSSTHKTKSTVYVSFCLSWTMVRGLRPLLWALMCENRRVHPIKA
jgi:hypothetical protein